MDSPLLVLPKPIVILVLSYLPDKELCQADLTCKKMFELAKQEWERRAESCGYRQGSMGHKQWCLTPGFGISTEIYRTKDKTIIKFEGEEHTYPNDVDKANKLANLALFFGIED